MNKTTVIIATVAVTAVAAGFTLNHLSLRKMAKKVDARVDAVIQTLRPMTDVSVPIIK